MRGFFLRLLITALGLWVADQLLSGITIDGTGALTLWDAEYWQVVRTYDWRVGPLTRVAFTADGLTGVCGTEAGQLVVFDIGTGKKGEEAQNVRSV